MRPLLLFTIAAVLAGCSTPPAASSWSRPATSGRIAAATLNESSGLAASRRAPGLLWSHNDSGGEPVLYALGPDGSDRGSVRLAGATNVDWEDIAAFELDGRAYLLVADTGDNRAIRHDCKLYVIAEPDPAQLAPGRELAVSVAWEVPVHYTDHPRDCESVAVDATEGAVYLLSKREYPVGLYRLPLRPATGTAVPDPQLLTPVPHIPQPTGARLALDGPPGRMGGMPTGMDFAPDRSAAVVVTYMHVLLFPRANAETWAAAFAREPQRLPAFSLPQAEAVCFTPDGQTLYADTEGDHAPILRFQHTK